MSGFEAAWEGYRRRTERALAARLPAADLTVAAGSRLQEAMRYACLGGGKRFRAMLVYACGGGATAEALDVPAAAVEMMHAYSLVHDDLPAMDDDELRRGRAACHVAFGEAVAILAGDALQALAFETLAADPALAVPDGRRVAMIAALAEAAGAAGMAGGQALDMVGGGGDSGGGGDGGSGDGGSGDGGGSNSTITATTAASIDAKTTLPQIHRLKTGALIRAAARLGGLTAGADAETLGTLDHYAADLGLAFQIVDDILDATAASGGDRRDDKATYVTTFGVAGARAAARESVAGALSAASALGDNAAFLRDLAHFAERRSF